MGSKQTANIDHKSYLEHRVLDLRDILIIPIIISAVRLTRASAMRHTQIFGIYVI